MKQRNFKVTVVYHEETSTTVYYLTFKPNQFDLLTPQEHLMLERAFEGKLNVMPDEVHYKYTDQDKFSKAVSYITGKISFVF